MIKQIIIDYLSIWTGESIAANYMKGILLKAKFVKGKIIR